MTPWYYSSSGGRSGPHSPAELQTLLVRGHITAETPVWTEGMADWQPLRLALPQLAPAAPPAAKSGCRKFVLIAAVLGVMLVLALLLASLAAIPVYNASRQKAALSSRDRDAAAAGLPAGLLPAEVQGYKLLSATDLRARMLGVPADSISGTYFPPFSTEITDDLLGTAHDKYIVYVRRFPAGEAAKRAAEEGLRVSKEPEGYFVPPNLEYGKDYNKNCYFRWVEGNLLFQIATEKSREADLRPFAASYRAAIAGEPR